MLANVASVNNMSCHMDDVKFGYFQKFVQHAMMGDWMLTLTKLETMLRISPMRIVTKMIRLYFSLHLHLNIFPFQLPQFTSIMKT